MFISFAILNIEQTLTETGYIIVVTTDIPCHLYCRITTILPQEHKIPRYRRGIYLNDDKYFCFDVYHDNEQEEVGNTLIHTFIKEPWPHCETRWFYFWARTLPAFSVSTSPIFKKHRIMPEYWPIIDEPWSPTAEPPPLTILISEPWTTTFSPSGTSPHPWPFYEPWGATIPDNNPWEYNIPLGGVDYELYSGRLRLYNPSMDGCGLKCPFTPNSIPLLNPENYHLMYQSKSIAPAPMTHDAYIPAFIWTTNGVDRYLIEMIITRGPWWGPWGSIKWGAAISSGQDYGLDPGPFDLTDFWIWARQQAGLPSDPTGWYIDYLALLFEAVEYEPNPYLINDYIGLFYTNLEQLISEPWTT